MGSGARMLISTVHIKKRRAGLIYLVMPGTLLVMSLISCGLRTGDDVLIPVGSTRWVEIRYNEPESPTSRTVGPETADQRTAVRPSFHIKQSVLGLRGRSLLFRCSRRNAHPNSR